MNWLLQPTLVISRKLPHSTSLNIFQQNSSKLKKRKEKGAMATIITMVFFPHYLLMKHIEYASIFQPIPSIIF